MSCFVIRNLCHFTWPHKQVRIWQFSEHLIFQVELTSFIFLLMSIQHLLWVQLFKLKVKVGLFSHLYFDDAMTFPVKVTNNVLHNTLGNYNFAFIYLLCPRLHQCTLESTKFSSIHLDSITAKIACYALMVDRVKCT